ncbi:hypothetical protein NL108_015763, partial [Boleophthalmus pectinirostris]
VDIEINGEAVDLHMKLGDNGEAFFVEENEDLESKVPAHLCTSPIPCETEEQQDPMELAEPEGTTASAGRRKKRRKKRVRTDCPVRNESSSEEKEESESPQQPETGPLLQTSKSIYFSMCEDLEQLRDAHAYSDSEQSPNENVFLSRPSSPKSDSELCVRPRGSSGPEIQWNWGGFPTVISTFKSRSSNFNLPNGDKTDKDGIMHISSKSEKVQIQNDANKEEAIYQLEEENGQMSARVNGGEDGECLKEKILADNFESVETSFNYEGEEICNSTPANSSATNSEIQDQDKKGEYNKRSHHLGTSGIYLDDLTSMDPEVALLYFPKTGKEASQPAGAHSLSRSLSPQSVGSGALDSGTDYLSDSALFSADVSLSLCGPGDSSAISKEKFEERMVTYQDFSNNPGLIDDPNLVVCINSNYYNWAVAGPMVLAMAAFQKNLPKSTVEQLVKDKMSKKSGRWWFPFRRRDQSQVRTMMGNGFCHSTLLLTCLFHLSPVSPIIVRATLDDVDSDEAAGLGRFASLPSSLSSNVLASSQSFSHMYRKSLRLTSKQIEQLNLCEGENSAVFSVTTQYQGTCRCEASIFLWSWDDRVVISDIDGTITKSDALGHLLTTIGADWTHFGIAKLYHRIHQNGYRFLYCSARAIGMSAWTKEYLSRVNDRGAVLPKGPVLLAPSGLVSALHREVIEKKPEVFKVACLSDIRDLFNPHREPFYAAFGNRTNDAFAYKAVGIPETRIFTVNPRGELIQEKTRSNKSS